MNAIHTGDRAVCIACVVALALVAVLLLIERMA